VIVLATLSEHKLKEIHALPGADALELTPIYSLGLPPEVEESGSTLEENAAIKAVRYSLWLRRELGMHPPVVSEDSGLQIEALLGWPGVESKRVADTDRERNALTLSKMEGVQLRDAYFVAYVALAVNGHLLRTWRGAAPGRITEGPRGKGGFGYDPIFEDAELGRTFAELSAEEKNQRSHRGRAWAQAFEYFAANKL
jgi:XTP/dITP diphosphohydrolase